MTGIIDLHIHSAPSLAPRHHTDHDLAQLMADVGVETFVLKAHEGSSAERAALLGDRAIGAVVLNSPVGGANPDAVEVAARLGARVAWLPTISSAAHIAAASSTELKAHEGVTFSSVPVTSQGSVLEEWIDVVDVVARHDMILASGHVTMDEAIAVFELARSRGVTRLLVNHPLMSFLGWRDEHVEQLVDLDVYLEVGVLADHLGDQGEESPTTRLARLYPESLLVFGSDLGHQLYPEVIPGITSWLERSAHAIGESALDHITTTNGKGLLLP